MNAKLLSLVILTILAFMSLASVQAAVEGSILFTSEQNGNSDIYAMSVDGSDLTRLTNNPDEDRQPSWSPDYRQIAYVSRTQDSSWAVFIMNADGSNPRRLTSDSMATYAENPTWSPDGQRIAFVTSTSSGLQVQVVNIDGSDYRRLVESTEESYDPAWSPDGQSIAYAVPQNDKYSAIFVADVNHGNLPNQLSREDGGESRSPAWSPDGLKIAYAVTGGSHGDAIMVRDADGVLTPVYTSESFVDSPVWSPDGSMIAFTEGFTRNSIIKIMNMDGTNVRELTEVESGEYLAWAAPTLIQSTTGSSSNLSGTVAVSVTNGVINTPRLNVRSQPNPDSYVVARISLNDTVGVIGRNSNGSWTLIDVFGRVGWINAEYVAISGGVRSLPIFSDSGSLPAASSIFTFTCPGARGPSFSLSSRFIVPFGDGPTAVREMPSSPVILERAPEGSGGTIIAGPICAAAAENRLLVYWYVRTDAGINGYMSEGYLSDSIAWIAPG